MSKAELKSNITTCDLWASEKVAGPSRRIAICASTSTLQASMPTPDAWHKAHLPSMEASVGVILKGRDQVTLQEIDYQAGDDNCPVICHLVNCGVNFI